MPYVYCTGSADTFFANHVVTDNPIGVIDGGVLIKGGSNVSNKHFVTPKGVVTSVTDSELAFLEKDFTFNAMKENGFISVEKSKADPDDVASNMEAKDKAAPLTPGDFSENDSAKPMVKKDKK